MAHILVYAQRTPQGVHPASAAALCLARDIASERGATVTAVCPGDAGRADQFVIGAVSRFGADQLTFLGPSGMRPQYERLRPLLVFVPYTEEGLHAADLLGAGLPEPLWLHDPEVEWERLAALTATLTGALPWYELPAIIDADYDNEASLVDLPEWVAKIDQHNGRGALRWFADGELDAATRATLQSLGAKQVEQEYLDQHGSGTLLYFGPVAPDSLNHRGPGARVMLFPGGGTEIDASWTRADWVIPGAWPDAAKQLHSELWRPVIA
jgi:hypothetical protein